MLTTAKQPPQPTRWCCYKHLKQWVEDFKATFPRKAHLANSASASMCGARSFDALTQHLPPRCPTVRPAGNDVLFAHGRLQHFESDRRVLIDQYRIKPDAADLFLYYCPVGSKSRCHKRTGVYGLDERFCYYADDEQPSPATSATLRAQYQAALGCTVSSMFRTGRLSEYLPPRMYRMLLDGLQWKFRPDLGDEDWGNTLPLTRYGWLEDPELGDVECFGVSTIIPPNFGRDELTSMVSSYFLATARLDSNPILVLNNRPTQYIKSGRTFTSIGMLFTGGVIAPCFVPVGPVKFTDVLVDCVGFQADLSPNLADDESTFFNIYWAMLAATLPQAQIGVVRYVQRPDGWVVPA
jgi:hypothetical protein